MSRRTKALARRAWSPLRRADNVTPAWKLEALKREVVKQGGDPSSVEAAWRSKELYANDLYVASVERAPEGHVNLITIHRHDREPEPFPWRHLQQIKSELAGPEAEAVELFPAESRLMDTANSRWLWCGPVGELFPVGFTAPRNVSSPNLAQRVGARQS